MRNRCVSDKCKQLVYHLNTIYLLFRRKIRPPYLLSQRPPLPPLLRNSDQVSSLIPLQRPLVCQLLPPSPLLSLPLSIPHHPRALESIASTTLCACSARSVLEFFARMADTSTSAKTAAAAAYVSTKSSEFIAYNAAELLLVCMKGKSMTVEIAGARVSANTANSEGVASCALEAAFAFMADTGTAAKNARALASARTGRSGTCATLAAARAFAPMAVTGTDARNARARVFVIMAGARTLAKNVAPKSILLLQMPWRHQQERSRRTSPRHEIFVAHHRGLFLFFVSGRFSSSIFIVLYCVHISK
jgi:hypothetical protein